MKIDRTFITDLAENKQDDAIVSTIISMTQHLQLEVIAEGVETTEQREILRKKQCTHIQGYLYSPPIAPKDMPTTMGATAVKIYRTIGKRQQSFPYVSIHNLV